MPAVILGIECYHRFPEREKGEAQGEASGHHAAQKQMQTGQTKEYDRFWGSAEVSVYTINCLQRLISHDHEEFSVQ